MMDGALPPARVALRPPEQVMRLSRMGSFHPSRLSFMRILLRRIKAEGWEVTRPVWDIDERGVGRAVYTAKGPERSYSLIAYSHDLPDHLRSDRVIAEAWDATFALHDGEPTIEDLDRLQDHVPVQEAGRMSMDEFTLSRANRSVRLFAHVVDALAAGRQPDAAELAKVGYLMRTTAVYGSGKFGLADREVYAERPELHAPFQAEMLTVWLIRMFSIDIVEHMARVKGGDAAVRMDPELRRTLGIGNSTGLGMAPFLLTHPVLLHRWIRAREEALARVRALPVFSHGQWRDLGAALAAAAANVAGWHSDHPLQIEKLKHLRSDVAALSDWIAEVSEATEQPGDVVWRWGEDNLSEDGQELLGSVLLEPFGELVDDLAGEMSAEERSIAAIDADMSVRALTSLIDKQYSWADETDWRGADATARLWYVSAEKLEPRLAERHDDPLESYEQPLAPARDICALKTALETSPEDQSVAAFLQVNPQHREAARRVQISAAHDYAEIRDNTIAQDMLPIDMLRAKLSFFGATRFDPRSDRWVRITMFNGAPFPDEINAMDGDAWMYGAMQSDLPASVPRRTTAHPPTPALRPARSAGRQGTHSTGWSMGEIAALAAKATRGVGLSWGLAHEAARIVRALSEMGLPGAEALAADLSGTDPGRALMLCCAISDARDRSLIEDVVDPFCYLLALPGLQACLPAGHGLEVVDSDDRVLAWVSAQGCSVSETTVLFRSSFRLRECDAGPDLAVACRIEDIQADALATLSALAAKTYAPATEASRLSGAGAGVRDND